MKYNITDEIAKEIRSRVILQTITDLHGVSFHNDAVEDIENGGLDIWLEDLPVKITVKDILANHDKYYAAIPKAVMV